nr:cyclic nucleotide-binding domain-containing protein [Pseudovibrio flavus]
MFHGIDGSKLRLLAFMSQRVEYQDGEELCSQGDTGDSAFVILSGQADVLVDGEKLAVVGEHAIVGEISILCDVPRTATLRASGIVDVLTIAKDDFIKLMKEFPEMSLEVMRTLAERLEKTTRALAAAKSAAS